MLKKFLFLLLLCAPAGAAMAQSQQQEANLKAAFIYNFTKYIDWDTSLIGNNFVIGIMGPSEITAPLNQITRTNTIMNKKIIVNVYNKPEEINNCQLLFIPRRYPYPLRAVLDHLGKGVLTVSEENGYAREGTAFNFFIDNDKLKFEANVKSILGAGLRASSQLLKLAKIVD
jgi:hypothetical protein